MAAHAGVLSCQDAHKLRLGVLYASVLEQPRCIIDTDTVNS